jgi:hypothetical protein
LLKNAVQKCRDYLRRRTSFWVRMQPPAGLRVLLTLCHLCEKNKIGAEKPGSNPNGKNRLTEKPFQIIIAHLPKV